MWAIALATITQLILMSGFQMQQIEQQALDRAKQLSGFQLDPELPRMKLGDWVAGVVGPTAKISWEVNDCGEQTGSPADRSRDMPMCVGVTAKISDSRRVSILIFVGTTKKGLVEKPEVYAVLIRHNGRVSDVGKLHDLPSALKGTK